MDGASDWLQHSQRNWEVLPLFLIVIAGITGNLLVCIAICKEKKLQNTTNYFLMSLSVADLFVCCVVMPLSIVNDFMGLWPLGLIMCDMWQVMDVMMCTSSIMHMCIISMDRYMAIRNPLKNRNKSRTSVGIKIATVWLISLATASPLIILCIIHPGDILNEQIQCGIFNHHFLMYGSLTAFFIPLTIMVVAYTLTIQLLRKQAINSSSKEGIRRTFSSKKTRFFSKDSVPMLKKISEHCNNVDSSSSGTPLNGYNKMNKKIRNSIESDRKSAHPSETEPLAVPCQTRKTSNISITTTITALNSPRPSVSYTQSHNNNIPDHYQDNCYQDTHSLSPGKDRKYSYLPDKEVHEHLSPIKDIHDNDMSPNMEFDSMSTNKELHIWSPNKKFHSMSPNKELHITLQDMEFQSNSPNKELHSMSPNKDFGKLSPNKEFHNHSQNKEIKSHSPNKDNSIVTPNNEYPPQYLTANYCQNDASQTTLSDISDPWELRDNIPYPQPPPSPARRYSHSVSSCTTKPSQEKDTLTPAVHRNSCTGAERLACGNNVHYKSKSEADITVHVTNNTIKPETQKLSLLCLGNSSSNNNHHHHHENNYTSSKQDNSEIQIHVPQNSLNHNSMLHKAIRKLSWGRLAKGGETNESIHSQIHKGGNNSNNGTNEPQASNMKFRQLMQKHRAAFKVAGILMAKREEKNQVKTERKAIKVLGTMFVIFVICWAPFFLTNFTIGVCQTCDIQPLLFKFFLWLGYVGSTLNPIIYTVFNRTFRKAFIKLLTCGKYTGASDNNNQCGGSFKEKKRVGSCRGEDLRTFSTSATHYKNIPSDFKNLYNNLQETHL